MENILCVDIKLKPMQCIELKQIYITQYVSTIVLAQYVKTISCVFGYLLRGWARASYISKVAKEDKHVTTL